MSRPSPLNIPDSVYNRVFQQDGDGATILQELTLLFHDDNNWQPGETPESAYFRAGQRDVILHLLSRSANQEGQK